MWHEVIIEKIIKTNADILFIVDPESITDYPLITESLKNKFKTVLRFKNEVDLRRELRKYKFLAVIFQNEHEIPYDLYSIHASIEISAKDIFPLLDTKVIKRYDCDYYQNIYKEYINIKNRYDRLSEADTAQFIHKIISVDDRDRIQELLNYCNDISYNQDYEGWGEFAQKYGELCYLTDRNNKDIDLLRKEVNEKFASWVVNHYKDLVFITESPLHSNILHRVFAGGKNALICFDCMGFEEWHVIQAYLEKQGFVFDISYSFSMLPSETGYSRRAIFSGLTPSKIKKEGEDVLFINSLIKNFGIDRNSIYFEKGTDPNSLNTIDLADFSSIGIIFNFIDKYVHSALMNKSSLIMNIERYLKEIRLDTFLLSLLNKDFNVYITSDHGSIFCRGNGIRVHKDLLDTRSRRYLISDKRNILEQYQNEYSHIMHLPNLIGNEYILLLSRDMYAGKKEKGLTHGGISVEEMVVPFVRVNIK